MKDDIIKNFAQLLIGKVRDAAIQSCDHNLDPNSDHIVARRWKEANGDQKAVIPDCVDETIFQLLNAIYDGSIHLTFRLKSGEMVDLSQEGMGELAGWYMGSGGWRTRYSKERYIDDFEDLT